MALYYLSFIFLLLTSCTSPLESIGSHNHPNSKSAETTHEDTFRLVSTPLILNLLHNSAQISWELSEGAQGQVFYGTNKNAMDLKSFKEDSYAYTKHNLTLNELTPDTTYYFYIVSKNQKGSTIQSNIYSFNTPSDPTPPPAPITFEIVTPPSASSITHNSVKIAWELSEGAQGQVFYGMSENTINMTSTKETSFNQSTHIHLLDQLVSETTYYYYIISKNKQGDEIKSNIYNFKTLPKPVTPPPPITFKITKTPSISSINHNSASITWELNEGAQGQVFYGTSQNILNRTSAKETSFNYSSHTQILMNLTSDTTYYFYVVSENKQGNKVKSNTYNFKTQPKPVPPPPMTTLKITKPPSVTSITNNSASITWELNEVSQGQIFYGTSQNTLNMSSTKETSFNYSSHTQTLNNLNSDTTYYFYVVSENMKGDVVKSTPFTFKTLVKSPPSNKNNAEDWILDYFSGVDSTTGDFDKRQYLTAPHLLYDSTGSNSKYAFDFRDTNNSQMNAIALVNVTITNNVSNDAHGGGFVVNDEIDTYMSRVNISPMWPDWESYSTTNYDGVTFGSTGAIYGQDITITHWNADAALDMKSEQGSQFVRLKAEGKGHYTLRYRGDTKHYLVDSKIDNYSTNTTRDDIIQIEDCEITKIYVYNTTFNGKNKLDRSDIECNKQYPGGTPQIIYLNTDPRTTGEMHPMFNN